MYGHWKGEGGSSIAITISDLSSILLIDQIKTSFPTGGGGG